VESADHTLRLAVAGLGALAREATAESLGGFRLTLLGRAREQLADIGVDSKHEGHRVEHDPRQMSLQRLRKGLAAEQWRRKNGASIGE
jgi:hypothetical protein